MQICFKNFDALYGVHDAHNLLLALTPLYGASVEGSPLRTAAHAAALNAVAQLPSKRGLRHEAARFYGKAMKVMATAISNHEKAQSDDTLMAILLLSWCEVCTTSDIAEDLLRARLDVSPWDG